uniref:RNA helicase n=1 Tax=Chrysotila carterae TaxID=13221 RepID=A0A7S4BIF4_CHRCT
MESESFGRCQCAVATPDILVRALMHAELRLEDVALLVIDEAHNEAGDHPYSVLMDFFYKPLPPVRRPQILALSATPVRSCNLDDPKPAWLLAAVEARLDAPCWTQEIEGLHTPRTEAVAYDRGDESAAAAAREMLRQTMRHCAPATQTAQTAAALERLGRDAARTCWHQLCKLVDGIWAELGPKAARAAADVVADGRHAGARGGEGTLFLSDELRRGWSNFTDASIALDDPEPVRTRCKQLLRAARAQLHAELAQLPHEHFSAFPKLSAITDYLRARRALKSLVFVRHRLSAWLLSKALQAAMPDEQVGCAVAAGSHAHGSSATQQACAIRAFHAPAGQGSSVLVSTPLLAEGIDVPQCDTLVLVDATGLSLGSYTQCRGRARAEKAAFGVLVPACPTNESQQTRTAAAPTQQELLTALERAAEEVKQQLLLRSAAASRFTPAPQTSLNLDDCLYDAETGALIPLCKCKDLLHSVYREKFYIPSYSTPFAPIDEFKNEANNELNAADGTADGDGGAVAAARGASASGSTRARALVAEEELEVRADFVEEGAAPFRDAATEKARALSAGHSSFVVSPDASGRGFGCTIALPRVGLCALPFASQRGLPRSITLTSPQPTKTGAKERASLLALRYLRGIGVLDANFRVVGRAQMRAEALRRARAPTVSTARQNAYAAARCQLVERKLPRAMASDETQPWVLHTLTMGGERWPLAILLRAHVRAEYADAGVWMQLRAVRRLSEGEAVSHVPLCARWLDVMRVMVRAGAEVESLPREFEHLAGDIAFERLSGEYRARRQTARRVDDEPADALSSAPPLVGGSDSGAAAASEAVARLAGDARGGVGACVGEVEAMGALRAVATRAVAASAPLPLVVVLDLDHTLWEGSCADFVGGEWVDEERTMWNAETRERLDLCEQVRTQHAQLHTTAIQTSRRRDGRRDGRRDRGARHTRTLQEGSTKGSSEHGGCTQDDERLYLYMKIAQCI